MYSVSPNQKHEVFVKIYGLCDRGGPHIQWASSIRLYLKYVVLSKWIDCVENIAHMFRGVLICE